ncbi:MAG: hypothetical protein AAGB29_01525 [Planctomycetota bacterium]
MTTTARLAAQPEPLAAPCHRPVVLVDGVPQPRLEVVSIERLGRAGRTQAVLNDTGTTQAQGEEWANRWVEVVLYPRLAGDHTRELTLISGQVQSRVCNEAPSKYGVELALTDDWSERLSITARHLWSIDRNGTLVETKTADLNVGSLANRSTQAVTIDGVATFVPTTEGVTWSIENAIRYLAVIHRFEVDLTGVIETTLGEPLVERIRLGTTLEDQLTRVLKPYDLWARPTNSGEWSNQTSIAIHSTARARRLELSDPTGSAWPQSVMSIERSTRAKRSQQWIAHTDGQVREGTFRLIPDWDQSLESAADTEFDRAQSSDFATYANVFRKWVLNEDGSTPGETFDLTGFFGTPVNPQTVPFTDCVTLDDTLSPRTPIVEYSIDNGVTWIEFPSGTETLDDQGGAYVSMTTLPDGLVAAGKSQSLLVRVTASLVSPIPEDAVRWVGNPFFGIDEPEVFDLRSLYRSRIVDASSIHRSRIDSGELRAGEQQAAPNLNAWLVERIQHRTNQSTSNREHKQVKLRGLWWTLHPGNRISTGSSGCNTTVDSNAELTAQASTVDRVRFRVADDQSDDGTTYLQLLS